MKRVKLIYNPFSGEGKILNYLDNIFKIYQDYGYIVDIFRISYETDLKNILNDIDKYDHFIVSGGDGTFNTIANILHHNNCDIPLAILPLGTANDFSKLLSIPEDIEKACLKIINSEAKKLDLGLVNRKCFLNIASLGIFSEVSQGTNIFMKKTIGKLAYVINGIMEVTKGKSYRVKVTSDEFTKELEIKAILVFNGRTAGNIPMAYNASLKDGLLDVIIIKNGNLLNMAYILNKVLCQKHLEEEVKDLIYFQSKHILIESLDEKLIKTDIDGENGPDLPMEISCLKERIKILGID